MKRIILIVAAAIGCCGSAGAQWFRQPTPNDTLQSVKDLPDGKVLFQIYAPKLNFKALYFTWRADLQTLAPTLFK